LPNRYTTITGLRRRLRVVYSRASPMLKLLTTHSFCAWPCNLHLRHWTWLVTWSTQLPSLKILRLFILEFWVIAFSIRDRCKAEAEAVTPRPGQDRWRLRPDKTEETRGKQKVGPTRRNQTWLMTLADITELQQCYYANANAVMSDDGRGRGKTEAETSRQSQQ